MLFNFLKNKFRFFKIIILIFFALSSLLLIIFDRSLIFSIICAVSVILFSLVHIYYYLYLDPDGTKKEKKTGAVVFISLMLIFSAYLFFYKNPSRLDLTKTQAFTLSQKSKDLLKSLDFNVKIIVLQQDYTNDISLGQYGKEIYMNVKNLVLEYKKESPKIEIEFMNPDSEEVKAKNYRMKNIGDLVIESDKGTKFLNKEYLVEWGSRRNPNSGDFERVITTYKIEEKITSAILSLYEKNKPKIIWLEGDGELGFDGQLSASLLKEELENNNFLIEKTQLNNKDSNLSLLESAAAMIIAGPTKTIPEGKVKLIEEFLSNGKTLFFLFDPSLDEIKTGMETFLQNKYNIKLLNQIVVDDYFSYQTISNIAGFYVDHEINQPMMKQNLQTILFMAAPIEITPGKDLKNPQKVEQLLIASQNAWEEKNMKAVKKTGRLDLSKKYSLEMNQPVKIEKGNPHDHDHEKEHDHEQKKSILLSAIFHNASDQSKVFVLGDSDIIKNPNIAISGNKDFIVNTINYLLERKTPLSVSKPIENGNVLLIQDGNKKYFLIIYVILLPLAIVLTGLFIGLKRRKMKIAGK